MRIYEGFELLDFPFDEQEFSISLEIQVSRCFEWVSRGLLRNCCEATSLREETTKPAQWLESFEVATCLPPLLQGIDAKFCHFVPYSNLKSAASIDRVPPADCVVPRCIFEDMALIEPLEDDDWTQGAHVRYQFYRTDPNFSRQQKSFSG